MMPLIIKSNIYLTCYTFYNKHALVRARKLLPEFEMYYCNLFPLIMNIKSFECKRHKYLKHSHLPARWDVQA